MKYPKPKKVKLTKKYLRLIKKQEKSESRSAIIKELDKAISEVVLKDGICKRCGKKHIKNTNGKWVNFGTSHYWSRDYMGTRFDFDNLDGLCWLPCHGQKWEHDKQGAYKDYMIKKLGEEGFERLEIKARAITKFSTSDLKLMLIELQQNVLLQH